MISISCSFIFLYFLSAHYYHGTGAEDRPAPVVHQPQVVVLSTTTGHSVYGPHGSQTTYGPPPPSNGTQPALVTGPVPVQPPPYNTVGPADPPPVYKY